MSDDNLPFWYQVDRNLNQLDNQKYYGDLLMKNRLVQICLYSLTVS